MKKVLFSILLSMMFLGICISDVMTQTLPALHVSLTVDKTAYLLNNVPPEPIMITITLENVGTEDIITSDGFSDEPFHLFLTFIDPDGNGITTGGAGSVEGVNPPVIPVIDENNVVQLLQVEAVEVLAGTSNTNGAFNLSVPSFDANTFYNLNKAGDYSVKAIIPMRTYLDIDHTEEGMDYAELEPVLFQGVIESNTLNFSLLNDVDLDVYLSDVDCDDNDPAVNPGATEIVGNGKDDDCNPATLDVVAIVPGTINVKSVKHTVGSGSHPGSIKDPIVGMDVRAFDTTNQCVSDYGISWQYYEAIWLSSNCTHAAYGVTGVDGTVSLNVPPGNYIVIGKYDADGAGPVMPIHIGVSAGGVDSGTTTDKYLQVIEKADGKKMPAKYTKKTGSELLIIEPEYVEWDGTQELYPFVFDSLGDWTVTTSVSPPEGFVADNNSLTEEVNTELKAVQFTITDIGSDWVDTGCTHEITHKGKKEKIKTKIGVKLSRKLAKKKGLDRFGKKKKKKKKK